jgi:N-acetyl-anhydromuramyl-L-alanine amidase AmpD
LRHVAGHEHVAPGRKTDPGAHFDWNLYRHMLEKEPFGNFHSTLLFFSEFLSDS